MSRQSGNLLNRRGILTALAATFAAPAIALRADASMPARVAWRISQAELNAIDDGRRKFKAANPHYRGEVTPYMAKMFL